MSMSIQYEGFTSVYSEDGETHNLKSFEFLNIAPNVSFEVASSAFQLVFFAVFKLHHVFIIRLSKSSSMKINSCWILFVVGTTRLELIFKHQYQIKIKIKTLFKYA